MYKLICFKIDFVRKVMSFFSFSVYVCLTRSHVSFLYFILNFLSFSFLENDIFNFEIYFKYIFFR